MDFPHEPSNSSSVLDRGGSKLSPEGSCIRIQTGVGILLKEIEIFGGILDLLPLSLSMRNQQCFGLVARLENSRGFLHWFAYPNECAAGCPSPVAKWQGRVGCLCSAGL